MSDWQPCRVYEYENERKLSLQLQLVILSWNFQKLRQHCSKLLLKFRMSQTAQQVPKMLTNAHTQTLQIDICVSIFRLLPERKQFFSWKIVTWWYVDFIYQCRVQTTINSVASLKFAKHEIVQTNYFWQEN